MPSPASRDDLEIALASPFSRSTSIALSMLPSLATSAFLQSRTPAPVRSRRVLTLSISIVAIISPHSRRPCCPPPLAPAPSPSQLHGRNRPCWRAPRLPVSYTHL